MSLDRGERQEIVSSVALRTLILRKLGFSVSQAASLTYQSIKFRKNLTKLCFFLNFGYNTDKFIKILESNVQVA